MSETPKWSELNDREQVRLILRDVMGYFILDTTATGWKTPEIPEGINASDGFHWPIAFWNTDGECWMMRDIATDPTPFNPLRDMNDAWLLFQRVLERFYTQEWEHGEWEEKLPFRRFAEALLGDDAGCFDDELFPAGPRIFDIIRKWTPELICKAAFIAVSAIVEDEQ